MPSKKEVVKNAKGFHVGKSEGQKKRDTLKTKSNPSNRDVMDMLELILERLEK